jgi:hypothetical protein
MAKARPLPTKSLAQRAAESTEDMADLAAQSGFKNVAMNLTNLAQRRRTKFEQAQAAVKALPKKK